MEDPSKYGVVVTDENAKVDRFVEKPKARRRRPGLHCTFLLLAPIYIARVILQEVMLEGTFSMVAREGVLHHSA